MPPTPATRADHLEHMLRRASVQPSTFRVAARFAARQAALVDGGIDETTDLGKTLKQVGVLITSTGEAKVDVTQALVTNLTNFLAPMGWTKDKDAYEKGPIEMSGVYYWTWKGPNGEVLTLKGIRSAQQAIPGVFSLGTKKASVRTSCIAGECKCGGECSCQEEAMMAPDACSAARVARRFAGFGMGPGYDTEGSSYNPIAMRGPYRPGTCKQVIEGDIISIKHNGPKVMHVREISAPNIGWILFEGYLLNPRTGEELKTLEIEVQGDDQVQIKRDL